MSSATLLTSLITPLLSAVVGGLIVHVLTSKRDKANAEMALAKEIELRKREKRVDYLTQAYRVVANYAQLYETEEARAAEIEEDFNRALNDLLLFGSPKQVDFLERMMNTLIETGRMEIRPLCISMREELRSELGQEPLGKTHLVIAVRKHGKKK